MRKLALTLTVALVVGGCTSETEIAQEASLTGGKQQTTSAQSPRVHAGRTVAFASLPDHGTLLAFDRGQKPVQRGAYTYHAVKLSEAHALNAAAAGKSIDLPLPSGETMRIVYQRHEEALDGNWSWIGKTKDGLDAVITFGEGAVFGRIYKKDTEAYSLTMSGGRSWLVQTDPSKLLDGNLGRHADESDALIPPSVAAAVSAKKRNAAAASVEGGGKASAANTVDVVLGYTNGLVTKYGSAANATTRLSNLMALTNQAYVNSVITPRVRLVRTVQVNYTDTNSNETALEALTGYDCTATTCTQQPVPAELAPLRTARDEYGADLVSLVRPFQAPQHQGCGIAWLLGGGGVTIDNTDAPFGYSIVSDGNDTDETDGNNYFCREETLAHELGHNMGQQHNIDDAGTPPVLGTHSYSYGYRETLASGFYTVMAYRLTNSSQFPINYFGNPSVNYTDTGRPTGTATADNARSMNISMPLVAQFRNTVVPLGGKVRNDINGDGTSDLLWHNGTNLSYWQTNATGAVVATGGQATPASYIAIATSDFDGNGTSDVLWRSGPNLRMWLKAPAGGYTDSAVNTYPVGWRLVGAGDVNNDGRADLIWQLGTTVSVWLMNGSGITNYTNSTISLSNAGNMPLMVADFTCDGRSDVLWRNTSNELVAWVARSGTSSTTTTFTQQTIGTYPNGWVTRGAGDFNGDGCQDVSWFNSSALTYWLMTADANGTISITGTGGRALPAAANLIAILDINGNGFADAAIRESNGVMSALMDFANSTVQQSLFTYPSGWLAVDGQSPYIWRRSVTKDLNADQRSDLGWTNGSTYSFWTMFGSVVQTVGGQNFATPRTVIGTGDFDGDLLQDVLFRTNAGELVRWRRTQTQFVEEAISGYPTGWTVAGISDIDGDGRDDIIWQNGSTYSYWVMEGNTVRLVGGQVLPSAYTPLAASDLDGDGRSDILWRASDNQMHVSKSIGLAFNTTAIGAYPTGWTFLGAGDVDGDLANDLMWHNGGGVFTHWKMLGLSPSPQPGQSMAIVGTVVATGDFDGNGRTDLVWRTSSDSLILAIPNGSPTQASQTYPITSFPVGWTAVQ